METPTNQDCRKNPIKKLLLNTNSLSLTKSIMVKFASPVRSFRLGSANFASKKYKISRATIHYWMKKLSNYSNEKTAISKDDQIRKLKAKVDDLQNIKDFQQELIVDFEKVTGEELSKKYFPDWLANEIQRKKKKLSK